MYLYPADFQGLDSIYRDNSIYTCIMTTCKISLQCISITRTFYTYAAPIEVGFTQDFYTISEGDMATVTYRILSDPSLLTVNDFASFDVTTVPGTALGMCKHDALYSYYNIKGKKGRLTVGLFQRKAPSLLAMDFSNQSF